jgi:hypothetical protein
MLEQDHRLSWTQSFQAPTRGDAVNDAVSTLEKKYPARRVFIEEVTVWGPFSPHMRKEALNMINYVRGVYDVNIMFTLAEETNNG